MTALDGVAIVGVLLIINHRLGAILDCLRKLNSPSAPTATKEEGVKP